MKRIPRLLLVLSFISFLLLGLFTGCPDEVEPPKEVVKSVSITTDPVDVSALDNDAEVTVTLASETPGATFYYTLDGSTPTAESTKYTAAFTVKAEDEAGKVVTVKAIGVKEGFDNSGVASEAIVFKPTVEVANLALDKGLIEDGTYVIPLANQDDQTAKTAWVQSAVEALIENDTLAVVSWNSETSKYDVALTNGTATGSADITVTEVPPLGTDVSLSSVKVDGVDAVVDSSDDTAYDVELPAGTDLSGLVATDIVVVATDDKAVVGEAATQDGGITWTVEVTAEDGTTKVTYTINVTNAEDPAIAEVATAKANLDLGDISAVTEDLTLPGTQDEATVTWASSDTSVISNDGKVTRPAKGEADATVTLTATIEVGSVSDTKDFVVTVKALKIDGAFNYTTQQSYSTIQAAVDAAAAGDVIKVGPGSHDVVYLESETFKHYLWINNSVTIEAADMSDKPVLKAQWKEGYGKGLHQQATVHITADDVTLNGLVIEAIEDYGSWVKVVEITDANNVTVQNCVIESENDNVDTSIYLAGTSVGKYTITNNNLEGGIVPANGAGNGVGGDESLISNNIIGGSISFTGKTNSGWDPNSIEEYPTITGNTINGLEGMLINSRDGDVSKLISDVIIQSIMNNNNFPSEVEIVTDEYEAYGAMLQRKRLLLK